MNGIREADRCARGILPLTDCMNLLEGDGVSGVGGGGREEGGYNCLQMIDNIKRSVQRLDL